MRLRPRRYLYIARKYWRKNPRRTWWAGRVWDEIRKDCCPTGDQSTPPEYTSREHHQ